MLGWIVTARAEVPSGDGWLLPEEREVQSKLVFEKRRLDWRHGRWTAKRALDAAWPGPGPATEWWVRAAADGAPEAFDPAGNPAPFAVSISHSAGLALCAVAPREVRALGCDLELVEPRSEELVEQFYTETEQRRVSAAAPTERALVACLIWSAKESALKAARTGLREDTRALEISWVGLPSAEGWAPFTVARGDGTGEGLCRVVERDGRTWVVTLLSNPPVTEVVKLVRAV